MNEKVRRLLEIKDWNDEDEKEALNLLEDERVYLAKHMEFYDGLLVDLSYDLSVEVRKAVASNTLTPSIVLERLSNDKNEAVCKIAQDSLRELSK